MNVVYDLLGFQSRDHGERGIARYVLNLALAIERTHPGLITEYRVHPDLPFPTGLEPLVGTGRLQLADRQATGARSSSGGVFIAGSPFECYNQPSDLILPRFVRSNEWRRMVVLHDLIPAIFPELYLEHETNQRWYSARLASLNLFDRFLANSQATADDALAMLDISERDVTVIGAGADEQFRPPEEGQRAAAQSLVSSGIIDGLKTGYILFPTGIDPRKNIERTIHAYGRLPERVRTRHQLVLACRLSDGDRETVMAMADAAGLGDELVVTGYVSDETLCRLYQGAHLVVFPSYYEGFGLPALEAMKCGAPVICADATSLVEVQTMPEARFDPLSVRAISAAMSQALADHYFRERLRDQALPPFTWDLAGQRTGEAVQAALADLRSRIVVSNSVGIAEPTGTINNGNRNGGGRAAKPRLALFAPLPPQQTGVAAYTYRLIEELRHHCDVTVFADCGPGDRTRQEERRVDEGVVRLRDVESSHGGPLEPVDLDRPAGVTVVGTDQYEAMAAGGGAFDQTLYFLGNSHHHLQAFQANKVRKGHVLLHDVRLTELYRAIRNDIPERLVEGSVGRTIGAYYPGRYRPEVEEMDVVSPETAHRFGVLLARGIADEDTELLVHSQCAKTLLRLDGSGDASIPFPMPCPTYTNPWQPADGPPIITSFGHLDQSRQPERLVTSMVDVVAEVSDARLRFVGRIDADRKHQLMDLADRSGVGQSIDFVGDLDDEQFQQRQRETWLAVHLRTHIDGASSETLSELLGLGVPTVLSTVGADDELPDGVVSRVPAGNDSRALGQQLVALLKDEAARRRLSLAAREYAEGHSFAMAAKSLAHLLFTSPEDRRMVDLTGDMAHLVKGQRQVVNELSVLQGATSAYLGKNILLTRLCNGQDIYVDGRDTSVAPALLLDGHWEPEATAVFNRLLRPSDCVIDVGANFGYFGLLAGAVVNPVLGGSVHMIEANQDLVSLVERSIAVNGLTDRIAVDHYAVSDGPGQLSLQVPQHLWGSSNLDGFDDDLEQAIGRTLEDGLAIERRLTVPAIDLDRYTEERGIDRVTLIKIDIEGHEERAYRGMTDVIARNRGRLRLLLEFSSGQYEDPVGFLAKMHEDFGSVAAIHPRTGQLIPISGHADVMALSRSGFAMLLAGGSPNVSDTRRSATPQLEKSGAA